MKAQKQAKALLEIYRRLRRRFGHRHWWPGDTPLEIMIGAILTQNTAWTNVEKAIANLAGAGVLDDAGKMLAMPDARLAALLRPSGYFNIKTQRLKHFFGFFLGSFGGSVEKMRAEPADGMRQKLLAVKGIGPETADSILLYALNKRVFVVDAYTRRIFSRIGMIAPDADYQGMQEFFTRRLPRRIALFNDYHAQIVQLGKDFCRSRNPRCGPCPLTSGCRFAKRLGSA